MKYKLVPDKYKLSMLSMQNIIYLWGLFCSQRYHTAM